MAQQTINLGAAPDDGTGDTLRVGGDKINDNFTELYTDKADKAGGTFTGDISVPDEAYDATAWNGSLEVPTKNAVRDKIESLGASGLEIEDEGVSEATGVIKLNFVGSGVAAVDQGAGEVEVTIPGGISTFAVGDATDVDTTGQATGDLLQYNGTNYVPKTLNEVRPTSIFEDQKAANTVGGASTSGSWIARTLNATVQNDIPSVALAANQISLPAGTYEVDAGCALFGSDRCRCRLQDVTNGTTLLLSENGHSPNAAGASQIWPRCIGTFTLAGTVNVELQYRVQTSRASNGLGVETNFGVNEIYSRVSIRKIG